ncbi:calcium uptake protein 3, mitochondrial isoform X3 [Hypanus sabinus]|uniref:calcium uptake protein 3, mitochondrial isoform X3 n=1 Tax=Hypanus sabinus TaxID=79690 RepID=UPI0028C3928B|nr:calcium uptake protein 3, mitochondrial isoform X3 [Hypanus sabinus]
MKPLLCSLHRSPQPVHSPRIAGHLQHRRRRPHRTRRVGRTVVLARVAGAAPLAAEPVANETPQMAAMRSFFSLQRLHPGRWRTAALSKPASSRGASWVAWRSGPGGRRGLCVAAVCGAAAAAVSWCYYDTESEAESSRRWALPRGGVRIPAVKAKEQRFRLFTSLEYEGQLFMTPRDFIESVTTDEPRSFKPRKSLSRQDLENMLAETPPVWKGSSRLFRTLSDRAYIPSRDHDVRERFTHFGLIAYTEYLFLLCILTKPHAGFKIAFNMFDTDGNEMVDKKEFLVLQEIFRKKNEKRGRRGIDEEKSAQVVLKKDCPDHTTDRSYWDTLRRNTSQAFFSDLAEQAVQSFLVDTTLLVHFFGRKGKAELNFDDFYKFMDNIQTEILETEFLSYSKGMTTISEEDFARTLLRYTNVDNTSNYLESVRQSIPDEKGITFDEFRSFFQFLNNLEDFAIAMQMYNFANRSIGQDEFKRAVYVATGLKLTSHLVNTVFKIFDVDKDDQLSYKEFIGVMKDRLHRGFRGYKSTHGYPNFKICLRKEFVRR